MKRIALTILTFVFVTNLFPKSNSDMLADNNDTNVKTGIINSTKFPQFSWDHVPVSAHLSIGKKGLTCEQYNFLADHFNFITFSGSSEENIAAAARKIKRFNSNAKILFYWSCDMLKGTYKLSNSTFPVDGYISSTKKEKFTKHNLFDDTRSDVREWWSDVAAKVVQDYSCDGLFVDGVGTMPIKWGRLVDQDKVAELEKGLIIMLQEARKKMGSDKLIIFNALHGDNENIESYGERMLPVADGAMMDDFDRSPEVRQPSKEYLAAEIEEVCRAGKKGKIVIFKGWPGFTWWSDPELMKKSHEEILKLARERITFPLACFLVAAQENCFFCYTWGWKSEYGSLDWYPEFDKPLGEPLGDMVKDGWEISREFKHASVWVNLETKEANIKWKSR